MALTDTAIKNAKPKTAQYKLHDEKGLLLIVRPTGGKLWRLKYRFAGKEQQLTIGTYPEVGLKEARERRDAARKGHVAEMRAIFADHLAEPQAQLEYARLKDLAGEKRVALLCFEADHAGCHRAVLAERLAEEAGASVVNL